MNESEACSLQLERKSILIPITGLAAMKVPSSSNTVASSCHSSLSSNFKHCGREDSAQKKQDKHFFDFVVGAGPNHKMMCYHFVC